MAGCNLYNPATSSELISQTRQPVMLLFSYWLLEQQGTIVSEYSSDGKLQIITCVCMFEVEPGTPLRSIIVFMPYSFGIHEHVVASPVERGLVGGQDTFINGDSKSD